MWDKEIIKCWEMELGRVSISCMFESCAGGERWVVTGVYWKGGYREETECLWAELMACKAK